MTAPSAKCSAKAWNSQRRGSIGRSNQTPPAHLDFDTWLGPAPKVKFLPNMLHSIWRWWHDFGTGDWAMTACTTLTSLAGAWGWTPSLEDLCDGGKYVFDDDMRLTRRIVFSNMRRIKMGGRNN